VDCSVSKNERAPYLGAVARCDRESFTFDGGPHKTVKRGKAQATVWLNLGNDCAERIDMSGKTTRFIGSQTIKVSQKGSLRGSLRWNAKGHQFALYEANCILRISRWTRSIQQVYKRAG
jgi:hypothetical protein